MLNQNPENLSLLLSSFFTTPHPLVIIIIIICKDWKNRVIIFLASVPGLPWAQKVEEKEGEKTRNKFFRSKYNSKLSI